MKNILFLNEKSRTAFFEDGFFSKGELASNYNDDLDQIIHTYLLDLRLEEINSFILPISINGNFFDFSGLIFAHHVRLTKQIKSCDATIVFYGILEVEQLLRLTDWARILLTPNVIYVNIAKSTFDDLKELIQSYSPKNFISEPFLEKIQINPPANYETNHHNVDNEFALIQWSKHIKYYNNLPISFKNEFDSRLYFKYLKLKKDFPEIGEKNQITIDIDAPVNILLIDDEAGKGWEAFYSSLFSNSSKEIKFEDSGIDFKDPNISDLIISRVENKVIQFKPDIVLLDLRLLDSDFHKETPPDELTGLKILDKIMEINKGIQVIITTASNKAWNFNHAKQKGAYDFIIKDGFEDPEKAIGKLSITIKNASNRSLYLKPIYKKMDDSLKAWNNYDIPKRKNISDLFHDSLWHVNLKLQVNDFVKNAFDTINNDLIAERFTISTVLLYRVIEMINEFYIIESGDNRNKTTQYHFDQDNSKVPKIIYQQNNYSVDSNVTVGTSFSTKEKSYAIYHKINGNINKVLFKKIHDFALYRNNVTIHPNKRFKEESLEFILDSDFKRFNSLLNEHFSAIMDYVNSFK